MMVNGTFILQPMRHPCCMLSSAVTLQGASRQPDLKNCASLLPSQANTTIKRSHPMTRGKAVSKS
eukprot:2067152-Amphidinium_carterae.1